MKRIRLILFLLLFAHTAYSQGTYTFSKTFTQPSIGDWIKFGQINTLPTGTFIKVKAWAHYSSQLFYLEFDIAATTYGNPVLDWVEVAPRLSNGYDGAQNFALDAKYKCINSCALELRLRRKSGGGGSGTINFVVESNASFSEADVQGTGGIVAPGFLGNNGGWKFPVVAGTFSNTEEGIFLIGNGNVGIGTVNPSEKLSVKGKIRAQEIKIEAANWPDFVFAKDYSLPTLAETEKHIKEKGHLPGIPSAAEVEKNGVELGEMNKKLLQKVEELTLYLIEMKKDNEVQTKKFQLEINNLKSKIK